MMKVSDPIRPTPRSQAHGQDLLYKNIVGASARMRRIFRLVSKVAPTDTTVLLLGESGTGKELLARSIHLQSRRASGPFVPVNLAALPDTLIESELFGAARGAFTGAQHDRPGLIEEADHGTLFLDEIGDMPLATQVKLLRTLESSEVRRLGDNATRIVDLRVVAATHRNLEEEVRRGRFREDLYYRLRVVQIDVPPLRERSEDIGLLASYFLTRISERQGRTGLRFTPETVATLDRYHYPGNVRELENAIEHAVTLSEGETITPADLPLAFRTAGLLTSGGGTVDGRPEREPDSALTTESRERENWTLAQVEKEHILRVLRRHQGNASAAARQLGVSRTTLWRKLREYGLPRRALTGE